MGIDVVVLCCSDEDSKWRNDFNRAKIIERRVDEERVLDGQSVGASRYRDWEMFRYWFRGLEKNCDSWLGRVFLVVSRESQVPKWLNVKHPKLRIVYHEEFVPSELLPTFNSNTIQFFISEIEDLGEEYLVSDDDCFFMEKLDREHFFRNGMPVKNGKVRGFKLYEERGYDKTFLTTVNNNAKFMQRYCNYLFYPDHLIKNRLKSYENYLLDKYYDEFYNSLVVSKFRHPNNYTTWLFDDLFRLNGVFVQGTPYENSMYVNLTDETNLAMCDGKDMICLNDTRAVRNFLITKRRVLKYLQSRFPKKSRYEV